ncbi:hypothetical protein VFMJ11_A0628 [Aliivibrio fischeri MJ11]|uniref:Uncharacterized protein n=1 Tax=Aliivibrio fischeri (strain MJ11) TaxID=388396 RepID=B5EU09_ALIFM|nr:hypothetical protein VFMJ11_A0628 [Aliivibrio fischeri MJ11]
MVYFSLWIYISLSLGVAVIATSYDRSGPIAFIFSLLLTPILSFVFYEYLSQKKATS